MISIIEKTVDFSDSEFDWNARAGLLDYYPDKRDIADGKVLLLVETGRRLTREKSGHKSGLSILGGGAIRSLVLDPQRSKPALVLLRQERVGWSGHPFWWPILAAPGTVEPCVFATKVAVD